MISRFGCTRIDAGDMSVSLTLGVIIVQYAGNFKNIFQHFLPAGFLGISRPMHVLARRCSGMFNFVLGRSICNGVQECDDGADEEGCSERQFQCDAGNVQWPTGMDTGITSRFSPGGSGNYCVGSPS